MISAKEATLINDICILKIDKRVQFDRNVARPCFLDMQPEIGEECFVAGYGTKGIQDQTTAMTTVGVFIGTVSDFIKNLLCPPIFDSSCSESVKLEDVRSNFIYFSKTSSNWLPLVANKTKLTRAHVIVS